MRLGTAYQSKAVGHPQQRSLASRLGIMLANTTHSLQIKGLTMTDAVLARLEALNLKLPEAPAPVANYVPFMFVNELLFVSGQISKAADGSILAGRLGADLPVEQGREAARLCALNILAQAHAALGRLDRIAQVVRLTGYVNADPHFTDHPLVVNGASDLMVEVLGEAGKHTRAAFGVSGLPAGCAVEVDAILQVTGT